MSVKDINELIEMAELFERIGERELATQCRDTARKILDHILYVHQRLERK